MDNYKVLFSLRVLKKVLNAFVSSFMVLYFLEVSQSNILPLGIYKLIEVIATYIVIFLMRNYNKSRNRINLLRIGIILDFIYFLLIILLKENVIKYIYLVGLVYGLEEGFYYSVYNIIDSDTISNENRAKFTGVYTSVHSVLSIIFPLIFGSLIYTAGFFKSLLIIFIIVVIRIFLSFVFKDKNIPERKRTNITKYFEITQNNDAIKQIYVVDFLNGLTYSQGAFSYIVTIYIIKVFSNSFSLGIFTSIFSVITCIIGILFAKFIKSKNYGSVIKVSMACTIVSLIIMIFKCNAITIVIFNLFQTISKTIVELINSNSQSNLSNLDVIKKEYKSEYWLADETCLVAGRIISNVLFIIMAYTDSNIMIFIFVIFLMLFARSSVKLQNKIKEE